MGLSEVIQPIQYQRKAPFKLVTVATGVYVIGLILIPKSIV